MKISIICPVFNKEKYILDTIKSVENQSCDSWELILVDDGSTDNSVTIINDYLSKVKSNIKVIVRKDFSDAKGANSCRNIGAKLAKNELLLFLDADDILLPNCIELRLHEISFAPEFNFYVFGVAYAMGTPPKPFDKMEVSLRTSVAISKNKNLVEEFLIQFLSCVFPWHTSGPIWRRSFFEEIGGFNLTLQRLQDPEIHIRALISRSLKMSFLIDKTNFDLLHRKDEDRQIFDEDTFFSKQIRSVESFLVQITQLLKVNNLAHYRKYLISYYLFSETLCYRVLRDHNFSAKTRYFTILDSLYSNTSGSFEFPVFYTLMRKTIRVAESSSFFLKKKVPGILLVLAKKIFI